uniref:Uncharacterized protein n=1 Tax=Arundo donax TaxID=35708 RepID=A0A0A9FKS4_ARUDO
MEAAAPGRGWEPEERLKQLVQRQAADPGSQPLLEDASPQPAAQASPRQAMGVGDVSGAGT